MEFLAREYVLCSGMSKSNPVLTFLRQQQVVMNWVVSEVLPGSEIHDCTNDKTGRVLGFHPDSRNFNLLWCLGKLQQITLTICHLTNFFYILSCSLNSALTFFSTFQKQEERDSNFRPC